MHHTTSAQHNQDQVFIIHMRTNKQFTAASNYFLTYTKAITHCLHVTTSSTQNSGVKKYVPQYVCVFQSVYVCAHKYIWNEYCQTYTHKYWFKCQFQDRSHYEHWFSIVKMKKMLVEICIRQHTKMRRKKPNKSTPIFFSFFFVQ